MLTNCNGTTRTWFPEVSLLGTSTVLVPENYTNIYLEFAAKDRLAEWVNSDPKYAGKWIAKMEYKKRTILNSMGRGVWLTVYVNDDGEEANGQAFFYKFS